jgi:hypothetical protein
MHGLDKEIISLDWFGGKEIMTTPYILPDL